MTSHCFELDLTRHCIETEVKRCHNRLISQYFKLKKPDAVLEEKIEMLEKALARFDFSMLRSHFPDLAGNSEKTIQLVIESGRRYQILVDGSRIFEMVI